MKKRILIVMQMLLVGFCIKAQQSASLQEGQSKVYFGSSSSDLTPAALAVLDELVARGRASGNELCRLELRAFTDDRGSAENNRRLALLRAQSVSDYLTARLPLPADSVVVLPPGIEKLRERAQARRVDIRLVWRVLEQNRPEKEVLGISALQQLFERILGERPDDQWRFDARAEQNLTGSKGARLRIPANAFVDAGGAAYTGEVRFELREAYSYGDMLLMGLGTTSGDRLLETGGMVYLQAADPQGNALSLAPGAEITVSLPTEQAQLPGMQVFEGVRSEEGNMDWIPNGQLVSNPGNQPTAAWLPAWSPNLLPADVWKEVLEELQTAQKWSRLRTKPPKPVACPRLTARKPVPVKMSPPLQPEASDADYANKIKRYYIQNARYRSKINEFRRDSIVYERELKRYTQKMPLYERYVLDLEKHLEQIAFLDDPSASYDQIPDLEKLARRCRSWNILRWVEDMNARRLVLLGNFSTEHDSFPKYFDQLQALPGLQCEEKSWKNLKTLYFPYVKNVKDFWYRTYARVFSKLNLYKDKYAKNRMTPADVSALAEFCQFIYTDSKINRLPRCAGKLNKELGDKKEELVHLSQHQFKLDELSQAYMRLSATGNITLVEGMDNSFRVSNMGWINCDRFYRPSSGMQTTVEMLTDASMHKKNATVVVIFKDIRGALSLSLKGDRFVSDVLAPTDASVEVVGIVLGEDGQIAFAHQSGKISELSKRLEFVNISQEQLRETLAGL